jgi:Alkylmercury lyase
MLLFRSEEHLDRWLESQDRARGEVLSLETTWDLARIWYTEPDRRDPEWRRRTPEEGEAVFRRLGLAGPFWRLVP